MKANDLMIGDWVIAYGKKTQVVWVGNIHKLAVRGFPSEFYEDEVEPIPLTKEILEKNGWYASEFRGGYGRKGIRLDGLDELPEGVDNALSFAQWSLDTKFLYHHLEIYMWKGSVHLWVNYVHELQHAFRMCGITKDIEL